ncbi:MAG: hypothetical protein ABIH24_11530 [Verrucomicrobiota bacterium]
MAVTAFYVAVFVIILAIRFFHFYASPAAGETFDSLVFKEMAALPWTDAGLWGGLKPPLAALCYKILKIHPQTIITFQIIFALLCWGLLAWTVAQAITTPWLKPPAYTLVLLFGLSTDIIPWDFMILSESLSISFFALLTAMTFRLLNKWHPAKLVAVIITGGMWAFCRETNAWLLLSLAIVIGVIGSLHRERRVACFVLASCWLAFFAANSLSAKLGAQPWTVPATSTDAAFELPPRMGQRWVFPFLNVLTQRILPDPAKVKWFADQGMPVTTDLMHLAGQWGAGNNFAAYRLDSLQSLRAWLLNHGRSVYVKYLVVNWRATILAPCRNIKSLLSAETGEPLPPGFVPILPSWLSAGIYLPPVFPFWPWIAGLTAFAGLGFACWNRRRLWWVPLGLLLLSYPHALLVWHGDAMSVERHALLLQIQVRLAFWIILLFVVDLFAQRLNRQARSSS